ncbi:hypothetical protein [Saccharothrix texasensis]|uniref:Uncharacterized protein n=1 Tax=Saccharothrix texasensis TaxID=103734 RepID=A0A3N1HFJ1_9PSEU|nr:hypothetical protein [Saccharothrix texasensis]ROP41268.1 hypothetical protein EDD40_6697 [Saccharothrix texasensis]
MSLVTVRDHVYLVGHSSSGTPKVEDIVREDGAGPVDVDLLQALEVNALAPAAPHAVKHGTRLLELALVTSYLRTTTAGAFVLRADEFRSSARRIKSFVTEAVGLGMLTERVRNTEGISRFGPLYDFDALPATSAGRFARSGVRPDLLFALKGQWLAGEARGRTERRPVSVTKEPWDRLNALLPWAQAHGDHPLVMTWCYLAGTDVTVDVYRKAGSEQRLPLDFTGRRDGEAEAPAVGSPGDRRSGDGDTEYLFEQVLTTRARVEEQLYRSAPPTGIRAADRPLRGGWAPSDLLAGEPGALFLGVLERPVGPVEGLRTASALADRGTDRGSGLSVLVRERLVLAVAAGRTGQPWDLLGGQRSS